MKYIFVLVLALGIAGAGCLSVIGIVKQQANQYAYKYTNNVPACYTAIVFGAGIRNGKPGKYLKDRLDAGIRLYGTGKVQRLLLSGDNGSRNYDELKVIRDYCLKNGVTAEDI